MENSSQMGYMAKLKTVSRQEAAVSYSDMNISTITTSSLESYIRSFFDADGHNRKYLEQFAPGMASYFSNPLQGNDATKTQLSVERYSERLMAHPPCFVINDTGVVLKPAGFGKSTWQSRPQDNIVSHTISVVREIPVTILVAASSKSSLASLAQCLHTIFFDISTFINGRLLHSETDNATWSLRLPLTMDAGTYDKTPQGDDPQMMLWTSVLSMTCVFEDSFMLKSDDLSYTVNSGKFSDPTMDFPRTMKVGKRYSGRIDNLLVDMKVLLSDHNVAAMSQGSSLSEHVILAKRPGRFKVQVARGTKTGSDLYPGQGSSVQPNIILEQEIVVTF